MAEPTRLGAFARACINACLLLVLVFPFERADARGINVFGARAVIISAEDDGNLANVHSRGQRWERTEHEIGDPARAVYAMVAQRAAALGVPPRIAVAIARHESGGHCQMHGRAGERGAMQVLPQTARQVGVTGNLENCAIGVEAGLRYLRLAMAQHGAAGWCAVASAYNAGTWRGSHCTSYGRAVAFAAGLR